MNGLAVTKFVTKLVVQAGTGTVIGNAIRATMPADISKMDMLTSIVAGMFIGGLVAEKTGDYSDEMIDQAYTLYQTIRYFGRPQNHKSPHAGDPTIVDIHPDNVSEH